MSTDTVEVMFTAGPAARTLDVNGEGRRVVRGEPTSVPSDLAEQLVKQDWQLVKAPRTAKKASPPKENTDKKEDQ